MNFTYEPLTKKQIEDVHQATLDVLEKCGVEMCDERAHEIFKNTARQLKAISSRFHQRLLKIV